MISQKHFIFWLTAKVEKSCVCKKRKGRRRFSYFKHETQRSSNTEKFSSPELNFKRTFLIIFAWRLYVCQSVSLHILNIFSSSKNTASILNQHWHKLSLAEENSSLSVFIKGQTLFQGNIIDDYFKIAGKSKQIYFSKTIDTFVKVLSCSIYSILSNRDPVGDVWKQRGSGFILEQIERIFYRWFPLRNIRPRKIKLVYKHFQIMLI